MAGMPKDRLSQVRSLGERMSQRPDSFRFDETTYAGAMLLECAQEIARLQEFERQTEERGSEDA